MDDRPSFRSASLRNTLLAVWSGEPTVVQMQRFGEELEQLARAHPRGINGFCVVLGTSPMPDAAARALMQRQFEGMRGRLTCMAVAMEKPGVSGALSRAVLSTLSTITRRPFKMSIHFQRAEAAEWLARQPDAPAAAQLLEAVSALEPPAV